MWRSTRRIGRINLVYRQIKKDGCGRPICTYGGGAMLASAEEAMDYEGSIATDEKMAEYYLLNYEKELKKYYDAKKEYLNYREKDDNIGGGKSGLSNPTEITALKGMEFDKIYTGYRWLKAVEIVQRGLGERKNIFIRVRREAERNSLHTIGRGRKGWVVYAQWRYMGKIEKRFIVPEKEISEKTLRLWWQQIINHTAAVAKEILLRMINT